MTTIVDDWASNENYGAGHGSYTGTPTKVQPSAAVIADGFVPTEALAAQHLNNQIRQLTVAVNTGTHGSFAELSTAANAELCYDMVEVDGIYFASVGSALRAIGGSDTMFDDVSPGSLTSTYSLSYDPSADRLVAHGTDGVNGCALSDDRGATWAYSSDFVEITEASIWDATNGLFLASGATTYVMSSGSAANGTWTARTPGSDGSVPSHTMATYGGITIRDCYSGAADTSEAVVDLSTNGTTWTSYTITTVAGTFGTIGNLMVDEASGKFVATVHDSTGASEVEIWTSDLDDGTTWAQTGNILFTEGIIGGANAQRYAAVSKNALVLAGKSNPGAGAGLWTSYDLGSTWDFKALAWNQAHSGSDRIYMAGAGGKLVAGFYSANLTSQACFTNLA